MDQNKFWNNKIIEDRGYLTPCWIWQGGLKESGYGYFYDGFITTHTHRVAYRLSYKDYNPKLKVLHKCDIPPCFNPEHLFQGTQRQNVQDCVQKGRRAKRKIKEFCKRGHKMTEENTYIRHKNNTTYTECKECGKISELCRKRS